VGPRRLADTPASRRDDHDDRDDHHDRDRDRDATPSLTTPGT